MPFKDDLRYSQI